MVTTGRIFGFFLLLVANNINSLAIQPPDVSTTSSPSEAPPEFPHDEKNNKRIMSAKETLKTLNLNSTDINDAITNSNIVIQLNNNSVAPSEFPKSPTNETQIKASNISDVSSTQTSKPPTNVTEIPVQSNVTAKSTTVTATINTTNSPIDTEVADLLNDTQKHYPANEISDKAPDIKYNSSVPVDDQAVLIENGENTEDILRNPKTHEDSERPGVPLVQGQLAAILAGVFVLISVVAYVLLLSWRRYLENRYGNRQMLVNEEEFDREDMSHFSI